MKCFLLQVLYLVVLGEAANIELLLRRNFLSSGARTMEDLETSQKLLQQLNRQTRKQLHLNGRRTISFSSDKADSVSLSNQPENVLSEEKLNRRAGIDAFLYQGDMALTEEQLRDRLQGHRRKRAAAVTAKWKAEHVPYFFDPSLPSRTQTRTLEVMRYLEDLTCIRFKEDRVSEPRIRIFYGSGCWSYVGRIGYWVTQDISFGQYCDEYFGTMAHELMHALGFYHEHSRSDRDGYIKLDFNNIEPNDTAQFNKESSTTSDNMGFKYEYGSIMHYGSDFQAVNKDLSTIVPKDTLYTNTIGQRKQPSFQDIQQINRLYKCDKICPTTTRCENEGYPNPNDCSKCICPFGFGGKLCNEIQKPTSGNEKCGGVLKPSTTKWSHYKMEMTSGSDSWVTESCTWQIELPKGMRMVVTFENLNTDCMRGCAVNEVELKLGNFTQSGYRICCKTDLSRTFYTDANRAILIARARQGKPSFNLWVKAF